MSNFFAEMPSAAALAKVRVDCRPIRACRLDLGKCLGSVPVNADGTGGWVFLHEGGLRDEGVWLNFCTAIIGSNTFGWTENMDEPGVEVRR